MHSSATQSGNINKKYHEMNFELKMLFTGLTQNPCLEKLDVIMKNEAFNVLFSKIMDDTVGAEAKMTLCFIKTVSSLLALVWAVPENNFEQHLLEEREMVKYCFLLLMTETTHAMCLTSKFICENYKVSIIMP